MIFLFELIPLKCIYLHRGYFGLIKNAKVREYSLQIMKIGKRFLLVKQLCLAFFERNPYFFYLFLFFAQSFSLRRLLHGVYTVPPARQNVRNGDQCSHFGKTIDALIIGDNF